MYGVIETCIKLVQMRIVSACLEAVGGGCDSIGTGLDLSVAVCKANEQPSIKPGSIP